MTFKLNISISKPQELTQKADTPKLLAHPSKPSGELSDKIPRASGICLFHKPPPHHHHQVRMYSQMWKHWARIPKFSTGDQEVAREAWMVSLTLYILQSLTLKKNLSFLF